MTSQIDPILADLDVHTVAEVPIDLIQRDPKQPRRTFNKGTLNDLAADIGARGVKQPITLALAPARDAFVIRAGERRWRAAKLAKLATVPAMLAPTEAQPHAELPITAHERIDQLAENTHRDELTAMDWAHFIAELRDDYGMTVSEIAAMLKERGFRDKGRSYLTNLVRLVGLPKPMRERIRDGALTAAHGKYLLTAQGLGEDVYANVEKRVAKVLDAPEDDDELDELTVREVQSFTVDAMLDCHLSLDGMGLHDVWTDLIGSNYGRPNFDVAKECAGCPKLKRVTTYREHRFCTDVACFKEKYRAAEAAANPGAEAGAEAGGVKEPDPGKAAERSAAKLDTYLDDWTRAAVALALTKAPSETRTSLVQWAGFGAVGPVYAGSTYATGDHWCDKATRGTARMSTVREALRLVDGTPGPRQREKLLLERLAWGCAMTTVNTIAYALDVTLDGYQIDEAYCKSRTKDELLSLGKLADVTPSSKRGDIDAAALAAAEAIGVPKDLKRAFTARMKDEEKILARLNKAAAKAAEKEATA